MKTAFPSRSDEEFSESCLKIGLRVRKIVCPSRLPGSAVIQAARQHFVRCSKIVRKAEDTRAKVFLKFPYFSLISQAWRPRGCVLQLWILMLMNNARIQILISRLSAAGCSLVCIAGFVAGCGDRSPKGEQRVTPNQSVVGSKKSAVELKPESGGVAFDDVAQKVNLTHVWPQQPRPMRTNESFGCGCAAFDFDGDGWQDILLIADPHPVLYRSREGVKFTDVTASMGLIRAGPDDWTGCAVGDYDGDGWLDVLLTGLHRLALYRNLEGQRFEETTVLAGLDPGNHNHWGSSAAFMDLDRDGWLDLVVLNYVVFGPKTKQYCEMRPGIKSGCPPQEYQPEKGEIWHNTGRGGFEFVPHGQGMESTNGPALVLAFADVDDDGRMDFYIGNDGQNADLLHNLGGMKFENYGVSSGLAFGRELSAMAAMGSDWGDFDRDGRLDLAVSNFDSFGFAVFRNQGSMSFTDVTSPTGVERATLTRLGFGTNWMDFDNDGWLDLAFVNGHVYENASEIDSRSTYRQPILLLRNLNGKKFTDLVPVLGSDVGRLIVGRGSTTLDFDNDGRLDLLAVDYEGPVCLLRNRSQTANHWLKLDLRGTAPNRFAYGARAVGKAAEQVWISEVSPASSYLSSKDARLHWGLGRCDKLESLTIRWPSGREQVLRDVAADQILKVVEPE